MHWTTESSEGRYAVELVRSCAAMDRPSVPMARDRWNLGCLYRVSQHVYPESSAIGRSSDVRNLQQVLGLLLSDKVLNVLNEWIIRQRPYRIARARARVAEWDLELRLGPRLCGEECRQEGRGEGHGQELLERHCVKRLERD